MAETKNFQEQYEAACWKIVDEMQEKFIDLCVDDNHSAYGNEMPQRQERFRAHLEKLNFRFYTDFLDVPQIPNDADVQQDQIQEIKAIDTAMGQDLDEIFELINGRAKDQFSASQVIINHQWDDANKRFVD